MTGNQLNTIQDNSQENWKAITDFPGYEVSDQGRVRSFWKQGLGARPVDKPQRILQPGHSRLGYKHVQLWRDGMAYTRKVSPLVLGAFVGSRPYQMDCCHNDGNPPNDFLTNLRWDTKKGNCKDKKIHGRENIGSRNGQSKLNESDIKGIIELYNQGESLSKIAKLFSVVPSNISQIITGKAWPQETTKYAIKIQVPKHFVGIEINGIKYESIIEAARQLKIGRTTIYKYLDRGLVQRINK